MTIENLGEKIRFRRHTIGLNQADLAEMAGTTPRTVFNIETGSGNPSMKIILAVLEVLGLDIQLTIKTPDT